jgi:hypothetical protein
MKTRLLILLAVTFLGCAATSEAGWGRCGWGGGWGGPFFGIGFVAPIPVYRPVYYAAPAPVYYSAPVYVRTVRYKTVTVNGTLVRAQSQLSSLGYYGGAVDGAFGPLTSRALAQYQADYGLPVTGRLDRATLKSLGI